MEVPLLLMADYANLALGDKLNVMGIFTELHAGQFPATHPEMYLVFEMTASPPEYEADRNLIIVLVNADGQEILRISQPVHVPTGVPGRRLRMPGVFRLINVVFPSPGVYQFSVLIDNDVKNTATLWVSQLEPSGTPR